MGRTFVMISLGSLVTRPVLPLDAPSVAATPTSTVLERRLGSDPSQVYFLYLPESAPPGARLLVSVHGVSRNAREHVERFARLAERYGVIVVAPLFPQDRFPDYQRLGREGRGHRADLALDRVVAEVESLTGASTRRLYLFGYSGGGQFVHRYAMAYPERVAAMVIGAAGWYTFPDAKRAYPRGIRRAHGLGDLHFDPDAFLRVPALVMVGERDEERDPELRQSRDIDRQQGRTRLERGRRWIEEMKRAARERGLGTRYRFKVLGRADHSFDRSARRGRMDKRAFRWLFGPAPAMEDRPSQPGPAVGPGTTRPTVEGASGQGARLTINLDKRIHLRCHIIGT
jgi:dienelactone hydrolase